MSAMLLINYVADIIIFLGCVNVLFLAGPTRRRVVRFVAYEAHRAGYILLGTAAFAQLAGVHQPIASPWHYHEPQWQMFLVTCGIALVFVGRALRTIFGPLIGSCLLR